MKQPILIFSHIPKTGGISLRKVVTSQYQPEQVCRVYEAELNLPAPNRAFIETFRKRRSDIQVLYGHFSYGVHRLLDIAPHYFTVLREPVERVISLYGHYARVNDSQWHRKIQQGLTLKEMISSHLAGGMNNHITRIIAGHPYKSREVITDLKYLDRAKANIEKHYVFTGTTSNLQSDVEKLGQFLGWTNFQLPRLNTRKDFNYETDAETRALIVEYNRLDIALYNWIMQRNRSVHPGNLKNKKITTAHPISLSKG